MENIPKKRRISLTKTQLQSVAGAELLALCQTITEDGSLSNDEINDLKLWLDQHRDDELPAKDHLISIVEKIVATSKVEKDERQELYKAIERILPPEIKKDVIDKRKRIEKEEKEKIKAVENAEKQLEKKERERNRQIGSANFMVAGVYYEGRQRIISRFVSLHEKVFLIRDHVNNYSRNAIEIRLTNGMQIGYVPEEYAVDLAPLLDEGALHQAHIIKILGSARKPIPIVKVFMYRYDANVEGAVSEDEVPIKQHYESAVNEQQERDSACEKSEESENHTNSPGSCLAMCVIVIILLWFIYHC